MVEVVNFVGIVVIVFLITVGSAILEESYQILSLFGNLITFFFLLWCLTTYDFAINISWVGG